MKYFKLQVIINEDIKNFDKNKLKVDFVQLVLKNVDGETVSFTNKNFKILYINTITPITFNIFILNDGKELYERIDSLLDEDYEIDDFTLDLYYGGNEITDYCLNKTVGEQVDLIKTIQHNNVYNITQHPIIALSENKIDSYFKLCPIRDDGTIAEDKVLFKTCGLEEGVLFNEKGLLIKNESILDKFSKVKIALYANYVFSPADIDTLDIHISNCLNIRFGSSTDKRKCVYGISKTGTVKMEYISPTFKYVFINCIELGTLYKIKDCIYFKLHLVEHKKE